LRSADTVAFNCGQSGADLFRQMVSLKRLLADRIKPDLLTIEVFAPQLCYEKSTFVTTPEFLVRARYDEIRTYVDYGADESALERIWRSSRFNPFSEYGMKNKGRTRVGLLFPNWIRNLFDESFTDKWGWLPSKAAPIPADEYAHGFQMFAPQYKEYLQDWHATPLSERCLMTMIAICKSHGIKTILVCMPNSSGLTNMYSKATCKSFNAYMSQIESQCGVKVINAASWVSDEGFADGVHLNATGAETFTLKLFGETFGSSSKNNITNLSWTSNLPISGIGVPHCIRPFVRAGSVTAGAFVIP